MAFKIKTITLLLLLSAASILSAQSYTLQQAINYGLENNTSAKAAALNVKAAEATVGETLSVGLPQLSGTVDYQYFITLPTSLIPGEFFGLPPGTFAELQFGTKQNVTAGLSFSQLLFNGSWLVGVSAARTYVGLVETQTKLTANEISKQIELAYYTALVSAESEKIWQKNIDNLEKTLFEVTELNKNGFVEEIDVNRLQISLLNLHANLENVKRQTELAKSLLKFQMGLDVNAEIILADSIGNLQEEFIPLDNDQNYLTRPEFRILETTRLLNEYNVRVNKTGYLPSLALYASYSQNAQRDKFDFFDGNEPWFETSLVGLKLSVPIFDGLDKKYKMQNAEIGLQQAELNQQTTTQGILLEIEKAKTEYLNAKNDLTNQDSTIALSEKIYQVSLIKYKEGVGSSLEITTAESSLYQAQAAYIGALYQVLNAKTTLKKALGY